MPDRNDIQGRAEVDLTRHHGFETAGPIAVVIAAFLALRLVLGVLDVPYAPFLAIAGAIGIAVLWIVVGVQRKKKQLAKASVLRAKLSELEEKEFALRYEEASMDGRLDRWKGKSS